MRTKEFYLSWWILKHGSNFVTTEPFETLHDNDCWRFIDDALDIRRVNSDSGLLIHFDGTVEFVNCFVISATTNQLPSRQRHFLKREQKEQKLKIKNYKIKQKAWHVRLLLNQSNLPYPPCCAIWWISLRDHLPKFQCLPRHPVLFHRS